jgi:WW domain-binding protein 2
MDFYPDQHLLIRNPNLESDSDEESSWVMLSQEGEIVKLPNEKIFYKVRSRISLELSGPKSLANVTPFSLKSDAGLVYITNHRVCRVDPSPLPRLAILTRDRSSICQLGRQRNSSRSLPRY